MSNQVLPQYPDDEVRIFHPFFEKCIKSVIHNLGLNEELEVVHHWTTRGFPGIIDFAICNKNSRKVLLPIEVKKTISDLKLIGRQQARGYSEALGPFRGSDYYLATNLEVTELFRTSSDRVLTQAQLLGLSNPFVGRLSNSIFDDFYEKLERTLTEVMNLVSANDGTRYASNISGLLHALEASIEDLGSWHQAQTFYAFEYIRGAFIGDEHFRIQVDRWGSANTFIETPHKMQSLVSEIDFDLIFERIPEGRFNSDEITQISAGAFESGQINDLGEDLSQAVNEIAHLVKKIPGVVETSPKLAELLVTHALMQTENSKLSNSMILEPGCGSGNLLVALKSIEPSISASQIFAFEKEELFREVLSLRVGLYFADSLKQGNRPNLAIRSLESLKAEECENVGLTILNPPFIRGIDCVRERRVIADLVYQSTGSAATLTGEQLGYECGYLELLVSLLPVGSIIAAVFPKNALLRPGSSRVRDFLLTEFGLSQIVIYNDENVFGNVQKSTVLLIGAKQAGKEKVSIYKYGNKIDDLNLSSFTDPLLREEFIESSAQILQVDAGELRSSVLPGWKAQLGGDQSEYEACIHDLAQYSEFELLSDNHDLKRGTAGNSGGSDLLFNSRKSCLESRVKPPAKWSMIPKTWIIPALKNSDVPVREISHSSGESGICLPIESASASTIGSVVDSYSKYLGSQTGKSTRGSQRKKLKSREDLKSLILSSKPISGPVVLIPRAQRSTAQIMFSCEEKLLISTNFFYATCSSKDEALILGSWLFSIFGQLQLEQMGIHQEGMRKNEKAQIGPCLIPVNIDFSLEEIKQLEAVFLSSEPLKFASIKSREIDEIWAKKLATANWFDLTEKTIQCLESLCNERLAT